MSSPESRTASSPTGVPLHVLVSRSNSNRSRISGFQGNPEKKKKKEIYIIRFAHSWNAATSGEIRAAVQLPHSNTSQQYGRKTEKSNALIINHPARVRQRAGKHHLGLSVSNQSTDLLGRTRQCIFNEIKTTSLWFHVLDEEQRYTLNVKNDTC